MAAEGAEVAPLRSALGGRDYRVPYHPVQDERQADARSSIDGKELRAADGVALPLTRRECVTSCNDDIECDVALRAATGSARTLPSCCARAAVLTLLAAPLLVLCRPVRSGGLVAPGWAGRLESKERLEEFDGAGLNSSQNETLMPRTTTATTTPAGMLGEYGSVTAFDVTEEEARLRVRRMMEVFEIREFQFYDTMQGYSHPPAPHLPEWRTACMNKLVRRRIIRVYVDEIRRLGGRSWLYVQSMASDEGDAAWTAGFEVIGKHFCYNRPVMDRIVPNGGWAKHIAPQWARFAAGLGFDGIHWDTLGADGDLPSFLLTAQPILRAEGLLQTCNFVDGAGWHDWLLSTSVVQFPYWEIWNVPLVRDTFFARLKRWKTGVFACYPGIGPVHTGEPQNNEEKGVFPLDIMVKRWQRARRHGASYLVISDGVRHIQTAYLPYTIGISWADVRKVRGAVFGEPRVPADRNCSCGWAAQSGACSKDDGGTCLAACCTAGFAKVSA